MSRRDGKGSGQGRGNVGSLQRGGAKGDLELGWRAKLSDSADNQVSSSEIAMRHGLRTLLGHLVRFAGSCGRSITLSRNFTLVSTSFETVVCRRLQDDSGFLEVRCDADCTEAAGGCQEKRGLGCRRNGPASPVFLNNQLDTCMAGQAHKFSVWLDAQVCAGRCSQPHRLPAVLSGSCCVQRAVVRSSKSSP